MDTEYLRFDENNGEPANIGSIVLDGFLRSDDWHGGEIVRSPIGFVWSGSHSDGLVGDKASQGCDGLLGAGVPNDDGISERSEHAKIPTEPRDINSEVLEGSERSAADRIKNGVTHGDLLIANVQAHRAPRTAGAGCAQAQPVTDAAAAPSGALRVEVRCSASLAIFASIGFQPTSEGFSALTRGPPLQDILQTDILINLRP